MCPSTTFDSYSSSPARIACDLGPALDKLMTIGQGHNPVRVVSQQNRRV
jgi:hypothetical protein